MDKAAAEKNFHYRYACNISDLTHEYRHKIVDWEAGGFIGPAGPNIGSRWEAAFRAKLERDTPAAVVKCP